MLTKKSQAAAADYKLQAAGLLKYVWTFSGHQALKDERGIERD